MLGSTYAKENCSIARALESVGERWSLLLIRDAGFRGVRRFSEFQRSLGLAPNVLAARLDRFIADGIMELRAIAGTNDQHEYVLTNKGADLLPALIALTAWGDRWAAPEGTPVVYRHSGECAGLVVESLSCADCGALLGPGSIRAEPTRDFTQMAREANRGEDTTAVGAVPV